MIRLMLAEQFQDAKLSVIEAGSGEEGKRHLDAGAKIDLVFTDVRMPGALDGLALARYVKSHHPQIPVILTSGFTARSDAEAFGQFLPKPYDFRTATSMVLRALGL